MPRATIIAVAILVVLLLCMVALANRNTEVAPHRIETQVKIGGAAGNATTVP